MIDKDCKILERNRDIINYIQSVRTKYNKQINSLKISLFFIASIYFISKYIEEVEDYYNQSTIIFIIAIVISTFLLVFLSKNDSLLAAKGRRNMLKLSKSVLIYILLKSIDRRIKYLPTQKILNKPIHTSKLFKGKISEIKGSDLITLEINNTSVEISMLKLNVGFKRIFSGIFVRIKNINKLKAEKLAPQITEDTKWNIIENDLYISIPLKFKKFLSIELHKKENDLHSILSQFSVINQIFLVLESVSNTTFEPITENSRIQLLEKYKIEDIPFSKYAENSSRILNVLIDGLIISIISLVLLAVFWTTYILNDSYLLIPITYLLSFFLYYFVSEYYYGQTVGKIYTRTKVVNKNDSSPSAKQILIRTLTRLIPFDVYSFIDKDYGWHDKLSGTRVIRRQAEL